MVRRNSTSDRSTQRDATDRSVPSAPPTSLDRDAVAVPTGQAIQAAVDTRPPGTTFIIERGVHRNETVRPKTGMVFIGEDGAILSGARVLENWTRQATVWSIGGQTQEEPPYGECQDGSPRCDRSEDLFVDDVLQRHVGSLE